ncbi:MAG: DNA-directed DNA polymerase II small subunit [Candidatus Thorarchaeota archaeon]
MQRDLIEQKRIIVNKLVNSGINISPESLEYILNMKNPLKILSSIIKELSFIPDFNSHITKNIIYQISNEELQRVLKRVIDKESKPIKFKTEEMQDSADMIKTQPIDLNPQLEKISASHSENIGELKMAQYGVTKSTFRFNPIAKDYETKFEILKDPTGKIYTNGEYSDFYKLTVNKFEKLETLMKKRFDLRSTIKAINLSKFSKEKEMSLVGLVKDIRQTKNGNYLISLEDLTGTINVLVRKDLEDQDSLKTTKKIIYDQMIYVKGLYNRSDKFNNGIIFADYISKIDTPTDFQPNKSLDPISIALISDTHIGSKEFEEPLFKRFIKFLNGRIGNKKLREVAGRVKYLVINGDLVDGIGVYPNQQKDLIISDIYDQFKKALEFLTEIPNYIKIFYISGNHEPVRNAIPRPAVPKKYSQDLIDLNVSCLGNPSFIKTHDVNTLIYHGESIHDLNLLIHELDINKPVDAMKELLICRHLAPVYGEKTQIAPVEMDWLVVDSIPDIFHTGHIHINGIGKYNNVTLLNSGCFQAQTDFMKSFGINPTPGIVPIIQLDDLKAFELDLKSNY